tara:strand:+ start:183 stop:491 length:309 start_codon:yes stop_codon:yes gene_type:complete
METKKATSFNYETYVVHVEITSKVNFLEYQSAKSIEDIVLKRINFDSINNTIVKGFVKSFLSSVNYESIADYINDSLGNKDPSNKIVMNSGREWGFMDYKKS